MVTIDQAISATNALGAPRLAMYPEFCVRVRNRAATCTACMDACPHGAILVEENEIFTDPEHCTSCGACTAACPTEALCTTTPARVSVSAQAELIAAESPKLALCCSRAGLHSSDDARFVDVECLAQIDEALLAHAALNGADRIALIDGGCATCPNAEAEQNIKGTVQRFRALCELWNIKATLARTSVEEDGLHAPNPNTRRKALREFWGEAKDAALAATAKTLMPEEEQPETLAQTLTQSTGGLKKRVPARAVSLANDLFAIQGNAHGTWRTRLFGQVHIDDACTHCGKCAFFCPTGALSQVGEPPRPTVMGVAPQCENDAFHEFRPSDCVRCGLCVDVCPTQALSLTDVEAETLFELEPQTLI